MHRAAIVHPARAIVLALVCAVAVSPSLAVAPALLLVFKQIAKQAASSMIKDTLLAGLDGMGCKGMAIGNALNALDVRRGAGAAGGAMAGLPMPPGAMTMPTMPTMPNLPTGMVMPGMPAGAAMPPEMAARLSAMMPNAAQLPAGAALDPDQAAMLARLQQSMAQPLSPPETLAAIDQLSELGFLPKAMQTELKECMVLLPAAAPMLGMGMGMLKPIIPQLQRARDELRAMSPEEQDEVAAMLAQEVQTLPSDQRAALMEHLDAGFFPPRIGAGVKSRLAGSPTR